MTKVRILQVTGDPVGGIRKHIHDILNGLSKDFDFFYICSMNGDKTYLREIKAISKEIYHHKTLVITKAPSISDIANILNIVLYIKKYNIKIVHGHGAKGGLYARICGKMMGCKVIYTPHGGVVHNMFGKYEQQLYKVIEKSLSYLTDLYIFESNYTKDGFIKKFNPTHGEKIVNYNGIKPPFKYLRMQRKNENISVIKLGVFGMLREIKGQDLAVDAVNALIKKGHHIELHFFGDGPTKDVLLQKVNKYKLNDVVFFHGEVDDVYHHMNQVDFILIPSRFESFGYVAVEAMLMKKLVVCSNAGGLNEIVCEKTGVKFKSADLFLMEKAIVTALLKEPRELNDMLNDAFERALSNFELNRMLGGLKNKYKTLSDV